MKNGKVTYQFFYIFMFWKYFKIMFIVFIVELCICLGLEFRTGPLYDITFEPEIAFQKSTSPIRVAVIREEGM